MNLSGVRTRVAGIIGLDTANSGTEQTLVTDWLNEAIEQFLLETRIYVKSGVTTFTADQWEYDVDTSILDWFDHWIVPTDGSQSSQPERTTASEIIRRRNIPGQPYQTAPIYIATRGWNTILVYPTPTAANELHFQYVPKPSSAMAATADTPSLTAYGGIPTQFHATLLDYVLWKAADYDDDTSSQQGMAYQASWQQGIMNAKKSMNQRFGSTLPPVRLKRRGRPAVSPGVDLG